ncbi:RNA dependent RNA polymerase-domain-containing protein [Absidia repens]|uniref:RNA-dependent RNA polymerase n=1 Tax=Absidia repens TaxID=90262 RepID=A0A1X2IK69_9FUNG|nr:RNA dependent RNA polymerase-domain-containing protein [Absidia repens]
MHLLFSTDALELSKTVGKFIQTSQRSKRKGTLAEFIQTINDALDTICQEVDDWGDDIDDMNFDDEDLMLTGAQNTAKSKPDATNIAKNINNTNNTNSTCSTGTNTSSHLTRKRPIQEIASTKELTQTNKRALLDSNTNTDIGGDPITPTPANPTQTTLPEAATEFDLEAIIQRYKSQLKHERNAFPGHNVITSPMRRSGVFEKAPWILRFELARLMSACQILWEELTVETVQSFIDISKTRPEQVHDAIMKWYSDLRSTASTAYGDDKIWNMFIFERCSDMVWKHGLTFESQPGGGTGKEGKQKLPLPRLYDLKVDLSTDKSKGNGMNGIMQQTRSIHYSAKVQFPNNDDGTPTITLNVPEFHASNRFFRKFGAERFLELRISKFRSQDAIRDQMTYFLRPFLLMGLTYRFLFFKEDRLVYFATDGPELAPISIRTVIDWHIPIIENWGLTTCKFASRMGLGYSNSIPTMTFEPKNVRLIDDVFAKGKSNTNESCMTDGCGIISPAAMRKIMGSQQNDILPCAVQGRIGGAKGVWIVPPDLNMESGEWIDIRASQNKFKTGLPGADMKTDPLHFTFDLVRNAFCVYPSHLNVQFIQCLSAGGVPTEVFIKLLKDHIGNMAEVLKSNRNNRLLRDWLAKKGSLQRMRRNFDDTGFGLLLRKKDDDGMTRGLDNLEEDGVDILDDSSSENTYTSKFNRYSGFPSNLYETLVRLLDAGFDFSNAFMANQMTNVFHAMMRILSTKYRVEVQKSCTVMCIPDPTGTLKPNEVFLQMSGRKVDPQTGTHVGLITGDIVVTRNPCGLKSDIQKVRAVDNSALRVYADVVVFSIQGPESLASKLGGGDYDGDLIFCCWDKSIVDPFVSSPVPAKTDRIDMVFEVDSTKVRDELRNLRNLDDQEAKLQYLFLAAPTYDGTLGLYENWRMIASEMTSLDTPDVIYLAQMCAILVDAPKQGSKVLPWARKEDRLKFAAYPMPEWFAEKLHKTWESGKQKPREVTLTERPLTTVMDMLHATICSEVERLTKHTQSLVSTDMTIRIDQDLASPWNKVLEMAANSNEDDDNDDGLMLEDLKTIQKAVDDNCNDYFKDVRKMVTHNKQKLKKSNRNKKQHQAKTTVVEEEEAISKFDSFYELEEHHAQYFYDMALPLMKSTAFRADVMWNDGQLLQTLKASYAYIKTIQDLNYNKYCYVVAYDVLARMKADACAKKIKTNGLATSIVPSIYPAMVMDSRWIRKDKQTFQVDV